MVLDVQQELIAASRHGDNSLGRGMSAMPSMHVATSTLFALFAWRVSPRWGVAATAFLAVICIASVHLGYHYALDGLVSIPVVALLWWASGLWARATLSPGQRRLASAKA
jgi:membrane-associated phospholipid phosphatase